MNSIPASQLVNVIPSVLGAGGNPLALNAVFATGNIQLPIDADLGYVPVGFPTLQAVADFFGQDSEEAAAAAVYFAGFNGATILPGLLYFVRFNSGDVEAYIRGGSLTLSLAQLQALSGNLIFSADGRQITSATINLASATSFSNAAALIQTGINHTGSIFSGTATQAGTTLTVATVVSGSLHVDDEVTGVTIGPATVISQLSGTPGGVGTYQISTTATVSPAEAVTVTSNIQVDYNSQLKSFVLMTPDTGATATWDSFAVSTVGALAVPLKLGPNLGAVISQGADAATPAAVFDDVVAQTQNWATFMSIFVLSTDDNIAWASWANSQNQRYVFVGWEETAEPIAGPAPDSFAVQTESFNGRVAVWGTVDKAAFTCAVAASLNFAETNGRTTWAYRSQAGLVPDVTDVTVANNLIANGYNFYGAYATANDLFQFYQDGQISGDWNWIDPFVNQIKMNSDFQLALLTLLTQAKSLPYVVRGYDAIRAALLDPINAYVNFGTIVAGVTLSALQRQQVNTAAGANIADVLQSRGWYLQILDASPTTRTGRGSPPITFWYTDGGSIQKLNMASIDVE